MIRLKANKLRKKKVYNVTERNFLVNLSEDGVSGERSPYVTRTTGELPGRPWQGKHQQQQHNYHQQQ